jgi:hypothetical protein
MLASLAPLCCLEPLGGVAPDHRAGTDAVELPEAHPGDLPAQRPVGDHRRELPLPELAVAVEHQGADVPCRAQQAVQAPSLGPGGTDGDPGASVQAVSHGHPWYGRPPTESNVCLPSRKDFLRKFLVSGLAGNSANACGHASSTERPHGSRMHEAVISSYNHRSVVLLCYTPTDNSTDLRLAWHDGAGPRPNPSFRWRRSSPCSWSSASPCWWCAPATIHRHRASASPPPRPPLLRPAVPSPVLRRSPPRPARGPLRLRLGPSGRPPVRLPRPPLRPLLPAVCHHRPPAPDTCPTPDRHSPGGWACSPSPWASA